jgi:hypothetical protein
MVALVILAGCAAKSVYRDVEGAPTTVYWQCRDNPKAGVPGPKGNTYPCPTLVDVYCGANRDHYVVAVDPLGQRLPSDPNQMCARIDRESH